VRGTVHEKQKDFPRAIEDYTRALELNAQISWAHLYRGRSYREVKDYRQSLADLDEFVEEHPSSAEAVYMRSNVRALMGDYSGAESDLTSVIALEPKRGMAYTNRGLARAHLGETEGALSDLRKALELEPGKRAQIQAAIDRLSGGGAGPGPAAGAGAPAGSGGQSVVPEPVVSDAGPRRQARPASRKADIDADSAPESAGGDAAAGKAHPGDKFDVDDPVPERAPSPAAADKDSSVRAAPKARKPAAYDDLPEPARKGAAPASSQTGSGQDKPAEHNSGQDDAVLIE